MRSPTIGGINRNIEELYAGAGISFDEDRQEKGEKNPRTCRGFLLTFSV
jgi:hypothetical protein